jgi:hypothetical protein
MKTLVITESQLKFIIENIDKQSIFNLSNELISAAQKVYDDWEQNEDGYCDYLGYGGICQDIADAICSVLLENDIECATVSQEIGEQHVYAIAKTDDGVFEVDISPYTYETGGGYCWKKIPDVVFETRDLIINRLSPDPEDFNQYVEY